MLEIGNRIAAQLTSRICDCSEFRAKFNRQSERKRDRESYLLVQKRPSENLMAPVHILNLRRASIGIGRCVQKDDQLSQRASYSEIRSSGPAVWLRAEREPSIVSPNVVIPCPVRPRVVKLSVKDAWRQALRLAQLAFVRSFLFPVGNGWTPPVCRMAHRICRSAVVDCPAAFALLRPAFD